MMTQHKPAKKAVLYGLVSVLLLMAVVAWGVPSQAQQNNPATATPTPAATITFTGTIDSISAAQMIVSGLPVSLQGVSSSVVERLRAGLTITVYGNIRDGVIIIVRIEFDDDDDDDDDGTTTPTPTGTLTVTPTGTLTITPTPTVTPTGTLTVTPTVTPVNDDDDDDDRPIIIIEGPITRITINTIVIFNLTIIVNDPRQIANLKVGDYVRIIGELDLDDDDGLRIILVNIIIIIDSAPSDRPRPVAPPPRPGGRSSRSSRSS